MATFELYNSGSVAHFLSDTASNYNHHVLWGGVYSMETPSVENVKSIFQCTIDNYYDKYVGSKQILR